jgi:transposase
MDSLAKNARLRAENEQLRAEVAALRQQLSVALQVFEQMQQRVQELEAQVKQDSHNSHWPSSRDKGRTKSLRERSGKKPGGQSGHEGRTLKMVSEPEQVVIHCPAQCVQCGHNLAGVEAVGDAPKGFPRQVFDLPPLQMVVTEHRVEEIVCPHCQTHNQAAFPAEVTQNVQYGPQVKALSVYLHQHHLLPFARTTQVLDDLLGTSPAAGTIALWLQEAAELVVEPVEHIKAELRQSDVVHCDETGLYIAGERVWLHVAATPQLTYYEAYPQRGRQGTDALGILPDFAGTAVHDNWAAYASYACRHALCNVHHLRELTSLHEQFGQAWAGEFKAFLLAVKAQVDEAKAQGETTLPPDQRASLDLHYQQLVALALAATAPPPDGWPKGKRGRVRKTKARNLAERFDQKRSQILAFVDDFAVPFDNNLVERDIRMVKVQQKISGCFRSWSGAQAACRLRSYLSTLHKQGHAVFALLSALFTGLPLPLHAE